MANQSHRKIVFVIGAGASSEINLPIGAGLMEDIAKLLERNDQSSEFLYRDRLISKVFWHLHLSRIVDINKLNDAAHYIRKSMTLAKSIDSFMDTHKNDKEIELVGKLSIVRAILLAEAESGLRVDHRLGNPEPDFSRVGGSWFTRFIQLISDTRLGQLEDRLSSIKMIVFNYDRCIEHFLFHALQTYYLIGPDKAVELIKCLDIYHPYGTVGCLPWQKKEHIIPYGAEPSIQLLLSLASQIKTFTEGTDQESSDIIAIRKSVLEANVLVFLGFSFQPINLKLLTPAKLPPRDDRQEYAYYATAKNISDSDCKIIQGQIWSLRGNKADISVISNQLECNSLFDQYWRSLSVP